MEFLNQDSSSADSTATGIARILVVAEESSFDGQLFDALKQWHQCRRVSSLAGAQEALERAPFDVLLIQLELPDGDGLELARLLQRTKPATKAIVISADDSVRAAVQAMRCGAVDFVHVPMVIDELLERIGDALEKARIDRQREDRLARLKKVCKQLNIARHEISEQIDVLCHELVAAYQEMSNQLQDTAMASEFRTLLRQELDVEELLRTALEYLLTKTGPTNAAVFLPDGTANFALGAYVNYDCPRDAIDSVLERLGMAVCPQMIDQEQILRFDHAGKFCNWVGIDAGMLSESEVLVFSCEHEGDCLAVVILFRSRHLPFDEGVLKVIDTLRQIFAEQLGQVIKVHHRAEPSWPNDPDDDCDELDFNDDAEFGYGGMAA